MGFGVFYEYMGTTFGVGNEYVKKIWKKSFLTIYFDL